MKRHLLIFGLLAASLSVNAAEMYWLVTADDTTRVSADYGYVRLSWKSGEDSGVLTTVSAATAAGDNGGGAIRTDLSVLDSTKQYSIFVELMNYNRETEVWSQVGLTVAGELSYGAEAVSTAYIDIGQPNFVPAVWHGGTIDVPEPTSGMLVMMGFAFLALKRRRV